MFPLDKKCYMPAVDYVFYDGERKKLLLIMLPRNLCWNKGKKYLAI